MLYLIDRGIPALLLSPCFLPPHPHMRLLSFPEVPKPGRAAELRRLLRLRRHLDQMIREEIEKLPATPASIPVFREIVLGLVAERPHPDD